MPWLNTSKFTDAEEKPKATIAFDFDGTTVENDFPNVGRPNPGAIEVLKELSAAGHPLILLTMRSDKELNDAIVYCNRNNIDLWGINQNPEQSKWSSSPKVHAHVYIDDAGAGIPLMHGGNGKPMVDWTKLREIFVSWELLPPVVKVDDGKQTFEIK